MDAPIVLLGLVTNLVEHSAMNRKRLLEKSQTVRFVTQSCMRYCRESLNIWNSLVVAEKENEQNDFTVDPQGIVLAAYMCLLLGCACVDSKAAQSTMLEILPDRSTRPFERLLTGFLRLQSVVGVLTTEALKGTRRVIELFRSYGTQQQKDSQHNKIDEIVTSLEAVAEDQNHVLKQLTAPLSVVISNDDDKEDVKIRKRKRKEEPGSPWRSRVLSRIKNSRSVSSLCDDGDMFDDDDEDGVEESNEDVNGVEESNEDTIEESIDEQDPVEESKGEESTTTMKIEETYSGLNEYEKQLREQLQQGQIVIFNKKKKKKRRKMNPSPSTSKTPQSMKRPSSSMLIRNDSFSSSSSSLTSSQSSSNGSTKKTFGRRKRKRHVDEITLWDED